MDGPDRTYVRSKLDPLFVVRLRFHNDDDRHSPLCTGATAMCWVGNRSVRLAKGRKCRRRFPGTKRNILSAFNTDHLSNVQSGALR
jgi:hypothetical protein